MKNLDENISKSLQKFKAYEINKLRKIEKEQKIMKEEQQEFLRQMIENLNNEIEIKKSQDDFLSPKQIIVELNISRKTFDRWVIDGLKILQRNPGASIRVKRRDLENYLKENGYDRLF